MVMIIPKIQYFLSDESLKSQSASYLRKCKWLNKVYWKERVVWSPGYFISSVGVDERTIKRYVEHQGQQDSGQKL